MKSHRLSNYVLPLCALVLASGSAFAQTQRVEASRQAAQTQRTTVSGGTSSQASTETESYEAPKMPGDKDYGVQQIIVKRTNWEPWRFELNSGFFYTTNAALLHKNAIDDVFFNYGVYGSYTPQIKGNLFGNFQASENFFRYNDLSKVLDFSYFKGGAGLIYVFAGGNVPAWLRDTSIFASYEFQQYADVDNVTDSFFQNHLIVAGAQRVFKVKRGHQLYVVAHGEWSVDGNDDNARSNNYVLTGGYKIDWTRAFSTGFDYRLALEDYFDADRFDVNQSLNLTGEWKFTDWAKLQAAFGWVFNNSDKSVFTYNAGTLGGVLNLSIRF